MPDKLMREAVAYDIARDGWQFQYHVWNRREILCCDAALIPFNELSLAKVRKNRAIARREFHKALKRKGWKKSELVQMPPITSYPDKHWGYLCLN